MYRYGAPGKDFSVILGFQDLREPYQLVRKLWAAYATTASALMLVLVGRLVRAV